jgi:hypothetical protein
MRRGQTLNTFVQSQNRIADLINLVLVQWQEAKTTILFSLISFIIILIKPYKSNFINTLYK